MGQLEGKTAVITGGGTGIGRATAVRLAAEGAHVFITGRRKAELDAVVEAIGSAGATAVAGDVTNLADLDRLYDAVRARGRGLDVVFGNAAAAAVAQQVGVRQGRHPPRGARHDRGAGVTR
ncbi:SDR family NAD(P)-dependent oxidoreductase, partial [Streptomyces violaceusniger]